MLSPPLYDRVKGPLRPIPSKRLAPPQEEEEVGLFPLNFRVSGANTLAGEEEEKRVREIAELARNLGNGFKEEAVHSIYTSSPRPLKATTVSFLKGG
jgi:hypothetical protein